MPRGFLNEPQNEAEKGRKMKLDEVCRLFLAARPLSEAPASVG